MKTTATTPAASIGGSNSVPAMKKEMVATYALLLAVRTSDSCAIDAATARPMASPTCDAFPRPCARPRYDANTASAATATMYVAAHGESSVNWLRAAEPRPLTRLKSLISVMSPCVGCGPRSSSAAAQAVAPDDVTPGGVAPGHVAPGHVAPGHVAPGHVAPRRGGADCGGHVTPDDVAPRHVAPRHVAPGDVAPRDVAVGPCVERLLRVGDSQCQ